MCAARISLRREKVRIVVVVNFRTLISVHPIGFLPRETAAHHRSKILNLLADALKTANIKGEDVDVVCYTKVGRPDVLNFSVQY